MKHGLIRIGLLAGSLWAAWAGDFEGLRPGVAKKVDADRVLGPPLREVIRGQRYDYDPSKHEARRISLKFNPNTQVIETIDLYFQVPYPKAQLQKWFELGAPARTALEANGNLIEYYLPQGVALYYTGPDAASEVEFFSHFEGNLPAAEPRAAPSVPPQPPPPAPAAKPSPPAPSVKPSPPPSTLKPYLGATVQRHEGPGIRVVAVTPDSPAARAGIRPGDFILELGENRFYENRIEVARFIAVISALPAGQPLRLLLVRDLNQVSGTVTLTAADANAIRERDAAVARLAFEDGRKRMQANDYDGAINSFTKAVAGNPTEALYHSSLSYAYYRKGDLTTAIAVLRKGISITPAPGLYYGLAVCHKAASRYDEAIQAVNQAILLRGAGAKQLAEFELLGECHFKTRRYREALAAFQEAAKINPRSPTSVYFLAGCYDILNDRDKAIFYYRAYLGLNDKDPEMNKFARRRLDTLTRTPGQPANLAEQLLRVWDTFKKDLQEFRK